MSWTEISPGHFQRPIGENETFIKKIGDPGHALGHEHWAINADATIAPRPTEHHVKNFERAWKAFRFVHPSIAAVASETVIDYTVPDSEALDNWAAETFVVHDDNTTREDIAAGMKPTPFVVLHLFLKTGDVLLHTSHWRSDGIGVLHLLNDYMKLAASEDVKDPASLAWGQEGSRLAPSIEEAAGIALEANDKITAEAEKWVKTFHGAAGAVGVDCPAAKETVPAGTRTARSNFPETTSDAIVKACKARKISVTSAVHAAIASTNWAFAPADGKSKHYTSTIRAALRPYLPEKFHGPAYAAALYTSGYMHSIPAGHSFQENAEQINSLYRQGLSVEFLEAHRQYALNVIDMIKSTPPDAPAPSDVDISSVGIVDNVITPVQGAFEVTSVSVGVEVLTRQMVCFVWTFRGKLSMNLVYNEAFYPPGVPVAFLEEVKRTLTRELEVHE